MRRLYRARAAGQGAGRDTLRSAEVMELARISRRTLDRWTAAGILPTVNAEGTQRRYRRADVLAAISHGRRPARTAI